MTPDELERRTRELTKGHATTTIDAHPQDWSLDMKRCYLPFIVTSECPECGEVVTKDLTDEYLSYPWINKDFSLHLCDDEGHEWSVTVRLDVCLSLRPSASGA